MNSNSELLTLFLIEKRRNEKQHKQRLDEEPSNIKQYKIIAVVRKIDN